MENLTDNTVRETSETIKESPVVPIKGDDTFAAAQNDNAEIIGKKNIRAKITKPAIIIIVVTLIISLAFLISGIVVLTAGNTAEDSSNNLTYIEAKRSYYFDGEKNTTKMGLFEVTNSSTVNISVKYGEVKVYNYVNNSVISLNKSTSGLVDTYSFVNRGTNTYKIVIKKTSNKDYRTSFYVTLGN